MKLGYDSNMELFQMDDKWNYQITVKGKDKHRRIVTIVYKTIDIIADTGRSSNLGGRATRVYEAYDVKNPLSRVVIKAIKDSWVDVNRPKEGDTLSEILNDASNDEKPMFLAVLIHGVVTVDGREDLTQDLLMNGYLISTDDDIQDYSESFNEEDIDNELQQVMAGFGIVDHGNQMRV